MGFVFIRKPLTHLTHVSACKTPVLSAAPHVDSALDGGKGGLESCLSASAPYSQTDPRGRCWVIARSL